MNLSYPVGCVLVRDAETQLRTFSLTPSYLAHGEGERGLTAVDVPWLSDFGFELSRGFHALKVWMALKEHGTQKFARVIQQNIDQARYLEGLVAATPELEQALPAQLNIVCFRYVGLGDARDDAALDKLNKEIELELQERGIAVPSVSTIHGRKYLHVAVANHRSRRDDFDLLVREVVRLGGELAAT
jgi:glutamate/tyrosine decarboxylase-like PLP-dependent enzyme